MFLFDLSIYECATGRFAVYLNAVSLIPLPERRNWWK